MNLTHHAIARTQQRCIPPLLVELLLRFGTSEPSGSGTRKVFFDKASRKALHSYAGALGTLLNDYLDIYAVVATDDSVITVAHRTSRIQRH